MTGSMSSLNTALSALRFNRVALDVAANNIANQATEGYTRRRAVGASVGTPAVPASWSTYDGVGGGVSVSSLDRINDDLLDTRSRREHASQSYLAVRSASLQRIETGIGEPGDNGVSAALADFRASWHDLANDPRSEAARGQVLQTANALTDSIHAQSAAIEAEASDQRSGLVARVEQANAVASSLAATNKAIASAQLGKVDTSDLMDQRDQLALRLSELTGATATARADGGFDMSVGGASLVSGPNAARLTITAGVTSSGASDGNPIAFGVVSGSTTTAVTGLTGEIGGVTELLTTTLPAYAAGLSAVTRTLADGVNALHQAGYDLGGTAGGAFFTYDVADPASTLAVAVTSTGGVAASSAPGGVLNSTTATALAASGDAETAYQRLVTGFGTEVASIKRLTTTQQLLTSQVDSAREQLSGVNLDEEMVSMVSAQRAYEAAARVMTVVDSVLDTLINRTGLL
ncbi:MAG: flagellar hook-associated protein FlgK, partial [Actinobacteria bacterium]|nr:flagellar hook-associated protein FlgK [Actinomycetota bacterium]